MPYRPVDPLAVENIADFFARRLAPENLRAHGPLPVRLLLASGKEIMAMVVAGHEDHATCQECHMTRDGLAPVASPWGVLKIRYSAIEAFWILREPESPSRPIPPR